MKTAELGRGALLGIILGAFVGAAALLVLSITTHPSCENLTAEECGLEESAQNEIAGWQRSVAGALALIGAGAVVLLRAQDKGKA